MQMSGPCKAKFAVLASVLLILSPIGAWAKKDCSVLSEAQFDLKSDETIDQLKGAETGDAKFGVEANGSACGLRSSLLATYKTARIAVRTGGKLFEFIPVLLTDKRNYNCYAVKVHTACASAPVKSPEGGFTLELRASNEARTTRSRIDLSQVGLVSYPPSNRQFFLVPYRLKNRPLHEEIAKAVSEVSCSSETPCDHQRLYFVERLFLERLRIQRRLSPLTEAAAKADRDEFFRSIGPQISGARKVIQTFITQNELGPASPYELQDAVLANSGPSFGAHQIDIATNGSPDVSVFREAVARRYGASRAASARSLLRRVKNRTYETPIREYSTSTLAALYNDWRAIDDALRSRFGKSRYNRAYLGFLASADREFSQLLKTNEYIAKYPWVGFYLIDIRNQYGSNEQAREAFHALAERSHDPKEFLALVQDAVLQWQYAKLSPSAACDTRRRLRNVILAVNAHSPPHGDPWPVPDECKGSEG